MLDSCGDSRAAGGTQSSTSENDLSRPGTGLEEPEFAHKRKIPGQRHCLEQGRSAPPALSC